LHAIASLVERRREREENLREVGTLLPAAIHATS